MTGSERPRELREMPVRLAHWLGAGRAVQLLTVDAGGYAHSVFTWAVAMDGRTARFGVDRPSLSLENLEQTGKASLQVAGDGLLFLIKGSAHLLAEQMRAAPFGYALCALEVVSVRDQSWNGVNVKAFDYEWPEAQRAPMERVQEAVLKEMREYAPDGGGGSGRAS